MSWMSEIDSGCRQELGTTLWNRCLASPVHTRRMTRAMNSDVQGDDLTDSQIIDTIVERIVVAMRTA